MDFLFEAWNICLLSWVNNKCKWRAQSSLCHIFVTCISRLFCLMHLAFVCSVLVHML